MTNDVQTDPTTNTLGSSDVRTEQNANESFNTSKATQNMLLLPIDIETPHSHNLINKSDLLQSRLKAEAQISALKSYVKCEISGLNNKMDSLNERLNHLMHKETSHSKAFELLQESVTFLQRELHSKDEIIKTLLETQIAVLDTVSKWMTSNTMGNEENVLVIDNDNEILSAALPSRSLQTPSKENTKLKEH